MEAKYSVESVVKIVLCVTCNVRRSYVYLELDTAYMRSALCYRRPPVTGMDQ